MRLSRIHDHTMETASLSDDVVNRFRDRSLLGDIRHDGERVVRQNAPSWPGNRRLVGRYRASRLGLLHLRDSILRCRGQCHGLLR